jgi:hypothetical protein
MVGVGSRGSGIAHPFVRTTRGVSGKFRRNSEPNMTRLLALLALLAWPAHANDLAKDLAPTGTLRAV